MTATLKLPAIGNSTGVIFPKEILEKLRASKGDSIFVTETWHVLRIFLRTATTLTLLDWQQAMHTGSQKIVLSSMVVRGPHS